MNKQDKKELRQQIACEWLEQNYLQYDSLRHDMVMDRLQIRDYKPTPDPSLEGREDGDGRLAIGNRQDTWRNLTDKDINTMVCRCVEETQVNISVNEMWTALKSDMVPAVHPIREWLNGLKPYKDDQPDWIDLVASQVRVKDNDNRDNLRSRSVCRSQRMMHTSLGDSTLRSPQKATSFVGAPNSQSHGEADRSNACEIRIPLRALGGDNIQQPKQLDPTTYSARNNTARGEGDDLNDNNDNLRGNQLPAAPEGNYLTANTMSDPTESGAHGLTSNSSQRERSEADRFWRQCFKKWFVAMVASWMKDEVVNHTVLVLVGRQGIFKTTWLDHLMPPELRAYSSKLPLSGQISKDDRLRLCENAMLNIDELDAICGREMNIVKSLLTSTDVNERAAYGRLKERRVRLASFCASTNNREFLTDITGNRRWLPFEVESIQNPFHTTLPYEYLYAQAKHLVEQGWFAYWFDMQEIEELEKHNEEFRAQDNEEQLLPILFDIPAEGKGEFMTTAEISERLVTFGGIKKPMNTRQLGVLMGKLKFKKAQAYMSGTCVRGWMVHKRLDDEIIRAKKNDIDHATKQQSDVF